MATASNVLLNAALAYAKMGYAVFPCVPGGKAPLTEHGFLDATTDPDKIARWWSRRPDANIGMSTQGMVVIDVDDETALAPEESWNAPTSLTPRGGRHHYFRQPAEGQWRNTTGRIATGVDTRGDGGYIIVPPSVGPDGITYQWSHKLDCPVEQLPVLPLKLQLALAVKKGDGGEPDTIPQGERNSRLASWAGRLRNTGLSPDELDAALQRINADRCKPPLSVKEVSQIAQSIGRYEIPETVPGVTLECPTPLPDSAYRVPGFVSEVMDYCLTTAPYPNQILAFCGALALQAFLAGRKVRDTSDNRTNIYILSLAHSAAGKDHPRKVNARIVHEIGASECLGDRFASGEGIQDAMFVNPCMLFQTDEIDGMLQSINRATDARYEHIMSTLLTMYSASNSIFPMRRKAGKPSPGAIDQPSLVIFGTAIPNHYYEALSERMLTNGFFARILVVEAGRRGTGQEPEVSDVPSKVLAIARWWAEYRSARGNLTSEHPALPIVEYDTSAKCLLIEQREQIEAEYAKAEAVNDSVGTTVWGRASEQTRKLALIYAVSENHAAPRISVPAVQWAGNFVTYQVQRMLYMTAVYVARNDFDRECKRAIQVLRTWRADHDDVTPMPTWRLRRALRLHPALIRDILTELAARREVQSVTIGTSGRPREGYTLT